MNNFEVTLLISPDISNNMLSKVEESFEKLVSSNGGSIVGKENWGLRDLAYSINNSKKAFYNFFQINIDGDKIKLLKKNLTQDETFIRHLIIKVKKHEELPTIMMKGSEQ